MKSVVRRAAVALLFALLLLPRVNAQVTYDRLLRAADDAKNWLTYNGNYASNRYSQLRQITPDNVKHLEQKWVFQGNVMGNWGFAALSPPTTPRPVRKSGAVTPSRGRARRATTPGRETTGRPAAGPRGSPARTTRRST